MPYQQQYQPPAPYGKNQVIVLADSSRIEGSAETAADTAFSDACNNTYTLSINQNISCMQTLAETGNTGQPGIVSGIHSIQLRYTFHSLIHILTVSAY
jgi:hypothetical protein